MSKGFLDSHYELKGRIDALKLQNDAYLTLLDLQDVRKKADNTLKSAITSILADIEHDVNAKMKEFNDSFYADARKAPRLHFNNYNSCTFETPDDTGTGTNYKDMVLYDLAVLYLMVPPGHRARFSDPEEHKRRSHRRHHEDLHGDGKTGVHLL